MGRVRHGGLLPCDEIPEGFVNARVKRWRFVLGKHLLPLRVGAPRHVERAFGLPLLDRVVVCERGAEEGSLKIGLSMGATQKMAAGTDLAQRVHGLPVLGEVDAL